MNKPNYKDVKVSSLEETKIIKDAYHNELKAGVNLKYCIRTYGCQMNVHDSEKIAAILEDMGYTRTDDYLEADFIVLNTCAIRENVHNKVFGFLGRIKHLKMQKPDIFVALCGCMSQEEVVVNEVLDKYKWLDCVFGTHNIHNLPSIIEKSMLDRKLTVEVYSNQNDIIENLPIKRDNKYKAWVNIMYGCDKFCTYCIVPYTRGKQRSRRKEDILEEIIKLKNDGYKEITLLGQNVNAYGKDIKDNDYFLEHLLEDVAKTKMDRIFFVTSHPWDFTDGMIDIIAKYDNVCPYVHLPMQSGSNSILRLMGRRYTHETYMELYTKIREKVKNVSITTDIIVGFPNETKEDFDATLDLVNKCKFDAAFTFIYSKREGTPAAKIEDNISQEDKNNRLYALNKIVDEHCVERNKALEGLIMDVLVDSTSDKTPGMLIGYTNNQKLVKFEGNEELIGNIVKVKITRGRKLGLDGELVNE